MFAGDLLATSLRSVGRIVAFVQLIPESGRSMHACRVTFGIIVLNGEPFTRYTLRALYPFAHEIIVVEGATPGASNIATDDGHSRDGTLETLRTFKTSEDPENKITIVTAEDDGHPNGFWPGEKDEQSRAYARRTTGDWLWQVDIDEFYRAEEMTQVFKMLYDEPEITAVTFKQINFWGGLNYTVDGWYLRRGADQFHRLFRWGPGYSYVTHRPPTVIDNRGRDLRQLKWIDGESLSRRGIRLYHYSLLLPKQVTEKCDYYENAEWAQRHGAIRWAQDAFLTLQYPFRVHNVYNFPSWLERYSGPHPEMVTRMVEELRENRGAIKLRQTNDIDHMLGSWRYKLGRIILRHLDPLEYYAKPFARRIRRRLKL